MKLVVLKFGGTSVADIACIKNVAKKIKNELKNNHKIVVVVSAMAGTTNQLIDWVKEASTNINKREYDVVVSSGEQITSGLLALALSDLNIDSRSWLAWQVPFLTDSIHSKASIVKIDTKAIKNFFKTGDVAVVAGFQGVNSNGDISTLGRGGSDTSAVAFAAVLKAKRCDIYTDVEGIYTSDPRIVSKANKLVKVSFEEMMEMSSQGAKVLETRSVALAMKYGVRIQVLSSFKDTLGTFVVDEEEIMEKKVVSGIAHSLNVAKITIVGIPDKPGQAAKLFSGLAEFSINVDMIVQSSSPDSNSTDLTFTVPETELRVAIDAINKTKSDVGFKEILSDIDVGKIAVVGVGMNTRPGVAQKMFESLAEKSINLQVISTSEIKISILIEASYVELALRTLHSAFDLDK